METMMQLAGSPDHLIIEDACLPSKQLYDEIFQWRYKDDVTCPSQKGPCTAVLPKVRLAAGNQWSDPTR